jgi:hypothetical protein
MTETQWRESSEEETKFHAQESSAEDKKVINIERTDTPSEIKKAAADAGIMIMRDVLKGIDDCVVFASTALYLQGLERGIVEFQIPPGDFDASVTQEQTLKQIQERLSNVPNVEFHNDGKWKRIVGDSQVLSGQIIMDIQTPLGEQRVAYPFEFFLRTFITDESILRHRENVRGLNVLTMEGLQQQYLNNLKFELRISENTEAVARYLLNPLVERQLQLFLEGATDPVAEQILKRLELTVDDIKTFYRTRNEIASSLATTGESFEERMSDLAVLLSGFKTKIPKRQKNIEQIRDRR